MDSSSLQLYSVNIKDGIVMSIECTSFSNVIN